MRKYLFILLWLLCTLGFGQIPPGPSGITKTQGNTYYLITAGNLVNVDQPPYNAVGDGVTDDSAAIQAVWAAGKNAILTAGKTYLVNRGVLNTVQNNQGIILNGAKILAAPQVYTTLNGSPTTSGGNQVIPVTSTSGFVAGQYVTVGGTGPVVNFQVSNPGSSYASAPTGVVSTSVGSGSGATATVTLDSQATGRIVSSTITAGGSGYIGDTLLTLTNTGTGGTTGAFAYAGLTTTEEGDSFKILSINPGVSITVQGLLVNSWSSGAYLWTSGHTIYLGRPGSFIIGPGTIDGNTSNVAISRWETMSEAEGHGNSAVIRDVTFQNTPGDAIQISQSYGVVDHCTFTTIGNNAVHVFNSPATPWTYQFTVTGASTPPLAGDTYTTSGLTYTVVSTSITSGSGIITATSTAPPSGQSGTLARATGSGTASISFSAAIATTQGGHTVLSYCSATNCHGRPQNGHTTAIYTGSNNDEDVQITHCLADGTPFWGIGYFHDNTDNDLTIDFNVCKNCIGGGIQVIGAVLNANPCRHSVVGNTLKNCGNGPGSFALYMGANPVGTITYSPTQMLCNSNRVDCTDSLASGIRVQNGVIVTIAGNNVNGATAYSTGFGIECDSASNGQAASITGNTVYGFSSGIFTQGMPNTIIASNICESFHSIGINDAGSNAPNTVKSNIVRAQGSGVIGIRGNINVTIQANEILLGAGATEFIDLEGAKAAAIDNVCTDNTAGTPTTGVFLTTSISGCIVRGNIFRATPTTYYNFNSNTVNVGVPGTVFTETADANNVTTTLTNLYSDSIPASTFTQVGQRLRIVYSGIVTGAATSTADIAVTIGGSSVFDTTALTSTTNSTFTITIDIVCDTTSSLKVCVTPSISGGITLAAPVYTYLTGLTFTNASTVLLTGQSGGAGAASNLITAKFGYSSLMAPIGG